MDLDNKGKTVNNAHNIFTSEAHNFDGASNAVNERYALYQNGALNLIAVRSYMEAMGEVIDSTFSVINDNLGTPEYLAVRALYDDLMCLYVAGSNGYFLQNLDRYEKGSLQYEHIKDQYYSNPNSEIGKTLEPIYEFTGDSLASKVTIARIIAKYFPFYTKEEMIADQEYCGIRYSPEKKVEFECTIEYTADENGNLCVAFIDDRDADMKLKYRVDDINLLNMFYGDYVSDKQKFATNGSKTTISFKNE